MRNLPPFVWVRGKAYAVNDWSLEEEGEEWLVLRPLSPEEVTALKEEEEWFWTEVFYSLPQESLRAKAKQSVLEDQPRQVKKKARPRVLKNAFALDAKEGRG